MATTRKRWSWVSFYLFLSFLASEAARDPSSAPQHGHTASTMVLPLFLSRANSSHHRRRELRTSNFRMNLHDGLETEGYYSTRLYIGTPPQKFALIVDSGSTVTYVPCSTCTYCGLHQDARFHPDSSRTYQPLKCNMRCTCNKEKNQCTYETKYAESSSSSGVLGEDMISFGEESTLKPQRAIFGCANKETGDIFSQHADGIIGLGRARLSIMDQLVRKGAISDSFSLCYGGIDLNDGIMVLGEVPPPNGMVFSNSNPHRSRYYNIELKDIHVSGKSLQLNPSVFDEDHGTVLDSGTTFAYLPEAAFVAIKDAIVKWLHSLEQIPGPEPDIKDICFSGVGSDVSLGQSSSLFPDVDMVFSNGQKISLSPENYLFRHSKVNGAYCLGILQNTRDSTTLLGGIIVRNTLVTYDRKNDRIGFWKTNCSTLWRNHSVEVSSPVPPEHRNSSAGLPPVPAPNRTKDHMAPMPAPNELQDYNKTVQFPFGFFIRFDMYLSIKFSDLVPHVPELTEVMAHNLEVNASQIHILKVKSEGDGSFIRWAIFPAVFGGFISNSTAMTIISLLTKHSLQLPEKFGSYQLLEWKFEPLPGRTWLQQHVLGIVLGALAVAVIASCFLIWYWYRRRHRCDAYRPVDDSVPEQELQPLDTETL